MAATKAGYEGQLFYGTAGAQAATQVTNCEDLNYDNEVEKVTITTRGQGGQPPVETEKVVVIKAQVTWSMMMQPNDATLTSLITAARTGAPVAIRTRAFSTGKGYDGDCVLTVSHEMTLKGQSKFNFTATPNDEIRTPNLNN